MDEIKAILNKATAVLSEVPGVRAVVLGGSRARGTHCPDSDVDIGIYYDAPALDQAALNQAAQAVDDRHRENLITLPGGWGRWVNGGGWLTINGRPVDFVLRDYAEVERTVREGRAGMVSPHYQTGHPHAFFKDRIDHIFGLAGSDPASACTQLGALVGEVKAMLPPGRTEHVTATLDDLSNRK